MKELDVGYKMLNRIFTKALDGLDRLGDKPATILRAIERTVEKSVEKASKATKSQVASLIKEVDALTKKKNASEKGTTGRLDKLEEKDGNVSYDPGGHTVIIKRILITVLVQRGRDFASLQNKVAGLEQKVEQKVAGLEQEVTALKAIVERLEKRGRDN